MDIKAYHILDYTIYCSDGTTCNSNYLDYLLSGEHCIKVCYNLDWFMARLMYLLELPENLLQRLWHTSKLYYNGYNFFFVPHRYLSIEYGKHWGSATFSDVFQYDVTQPYDVDPNDAVLSAVGIAYEVHDVLDKLGITSSSLSSPVSAYQKSFLNDRDLPTWEDNPDEVNEYAYQCMSGGWQECFKKGHYDAVWDYDMTSAYSYETMNLIDTRFGTWNKSTKFNHSTPYGFWKGIVQVDSDFSPIIFKGSTSTTPKGEFYRYLTTNQILQLYKYKLGSFKLADGWYWQPDTIEYPLKDDIEILFDWKQNLKGLQRDITKRIMCFSSDTDVWTTNGIKNVSDLKIGDLVYSINPDTLITEIKPIISLYKYDYNGDVYSLCTHKHNFIVTPEHKFLLRKSGRKSFKFNTLDNIFKYKDGKWNFPKLTPIKGKQLKYINLWGYVDINDTISVIPNKKYSSTFEKDKRFRYIGSGNGYITTKSVIGSDPKDFESRYDCKLYTKSGIGGYRNSWLYDTNLLLELAGWFVSEGHVEIDTVCNSYRIGITNKNIEQIAWLCTQLNLHYSISNSSTECKTLRIPSKILTTFLINNFGSKADNKKINTKLLELDHTHLYHLYKTMMLGDGSMKDRQMYKYTSISERLVNDFRQLCLHLGLKTNHKVEKRYSGHMGMNTIHRVYIYNNNFNVGLNKDDIKTIHYNGTVYCVSVADNHTLLAGRKGIYEFTGNSGIWGKTAEIFPDGSFGKLFNPVWAAMTETPVLIKVADFILSNKATDNIISIAVDGAVFDKEIPIQHDDAIGSWRLNTTAPGYFISSGISTIKGKESKGNFALRYDWLEDQIKLNPEANEYVMQKRTPVTLGYALSQHKLDILGELELKSRSVIIDYEIKRNFPILPKNGKELQDNIYTSTAWDISLIKFREYFE